MKKLKSREFKVLYADPVDPNLVIDREQEPIMLENVKLEAELRAAYYRRFQEKQYKNAKDELEKSAERIMDKYEPVFKKLVKE